MANKVALNLSPNMVGEYNDVVNFPHKLLLTHTQVSRLRKAFTNNLSANLKSSKTQLHKIVFLGRLLAPVLKTGLPLMKIVLKPLVKSVLISLGLPASALAKDAAIFKIFLDQVRQH